MCDYSLHSVASRPAKVGDKLVVTDFAQSITRGFAAVGEPDVAICLLPGTELAFEDDVRYHHALSLFGKARVGHKVARFRQVNMHDPHVHHDALEFPGGPDRDGHTAGRWTESDCAAIAGAAHDRVGDRVPEARRLRGLSTAHYVIGRPPTRRPTYAESALNWLRFQAA